MYILLFILAGFFFLGGLVSLGSSTNSLLSFSLFFVFLFLGLRSKERKTTLKKNDKVDSQYVKAIGETATGLVKIINESLSIANDSKNPGTKISRLNVAKDKLEELKKLEEENSFIHIDNMNGIESTIRELELGFETAGYKETAQGNMDGQFLEKAGKIDDAIAIYEDLLSSSVDTPFTYRRLAILYRKKKQKDDEIRVIKSALNNIPSSNSKHYQWFAERLSKMV